MVVPFDMWDAVVKIIGHLNQRFRSSQLPWMQAQSKPQAIDKRRDSKRDGLTLL